MDDELKFILNEQLAIVTIEHERIEFNGNKDNKELVEVACWFNGLSVEIY